MDSTMRCTIKELLSTIEYLDVLCEREYNQIDTTSIKKEVEELVKQIELAEYDSGDVYNSPDLRRVRILFGTASMGERRA